MTKRKKGLVAKTIEIFSVKRKPKETAKKRSLDDLLLNYVDEKESKSYQSAGFSGLSDALDHIADKAPRK